MRVWVRERERERVSANAMLSFLTYQYSYHISRLAHSLAKTLTHSLYLSHTNTLRHTHIFYKQTHTDLATVHHITTSTILDRRIRCPIS